MKKILVVATLTMAMAGAALARTARAPSDEDVNRAIDARLHAMLLKLNAEKK
jgi:hypothetical protein